MSLGDYFIRQHHSVADIVKMEYAASHHKKYGNISFEINSSKHGPIAIDVSQGKNASEVYYNGQRLAEIVHETFGQFFHGRTITVYAYPFK